MLTLLVDEAFAFDYLAILWVKAENGLKVQDHLKEVSHHIVTQVGRQKHAEIVRSVEFQDLLDANRALWMQEEDARGMSAKGGDIPHSLIQVGNDKRYRAKVALQAAHFKNALKERKSFS